MLEDTHLRRKRAWPVSGGRNHSGEAENVGQRLRYIREHMKWGLDRTIVRNKETDGRVQRRRKGITVEL